MWNEGYVTTRIRWCFFRQLADSENLQEFHLLAGLGNISLHGSDTYKQNQTDDIDDHRFKQTCSWKANLCCVQQLWFCHIYFTLYSDAYPRLAHVIATVFQDLPFTHRLMVWPMYPKQFFQHCTYDQPNPNTTVFSWIFQIIKTVPKTPLTSKCFATLSTIFCWHNWLADFPLFLWGGGKMGRWGCRVDWLDALKF